MIQAIENVRFVLHDLERKLQQDKHYNPLVLLEIAAAVIRSEDEGLTKDFLRFYSWFESMELLSDRDISRTVFPQHNYLESGDLE